MPIFGMFLSKLVLCSSTVVLLQNMQFMSHKNFFMLFLSFEDLDSHWSQFSFIWKRAALTFCKMSPCMFHRKRYISHSVVLWETGKILVIDQYSWQPN